MTCGGWGCCRWSPKSCSLRISSRKQVFRVRQTEAGSIKFEIVHFAFLTRAGLIKVWVVEVCHGLPDCTAFSFDAKRRAEYAHVRQCIRNDGGNIYVRSHSRLNFCLDRALICCSMLRSINRSDEFSLRRFVKDRYNFYATHLIFGL